ncbi:MAG TPA: glycosyltransferase, partial [Thermoleophilia bacterium]|nr:glycosyltransferase [Thermoleophilia bacterium]
MKVLVISHLYPAPGHERHLFVHEQVLGLRAAGVEVSVFSPTGYSPRLPLLSGARLRRRRATPASAVRDGVAIEYPRVLVLPRRLLYDRAGEIFHATLARRVPALRAAGIELIHAHQAMPDGAAAARLARDLDVPYVVTVHGVDVYQHLRDGGRVADRTIEVVGGAAAVIGVSSSVTRRLARYVSPERLFVNHNGTLGASDAAEAAGGVAEVVGGAAAAAGDAAAAAGDAAPTDGADGSGLPNAEGLLAAAGIGPEEPVVLTAGYLIERKGHRVMLDALARIGADRG